MNKSKVRHFNAIALQWGGLAGYHDRWWMRHRSPAAYAFKQWLLANGWEYDHCFAGLSNPDHPMLNPKGIGFSVLPPIVR